MSNYLPTYTGSPAHILVVDDEPGVRYFLEEALESEGYQVTVAESGESALAQIEAREFDLALVDLKLPGISGIEFLTALRRRSPATSAIVLTAHASLETAVEALRQGAHDYLFKPCESSHLRECVRTGLARRRHNLRYQEVLTRLEQNLSSSLEEILATAFERVTTTPSTMPTEAEVEERFLRHGGLIIDSSRRIATLNDQVLELSPAELDILVYLAIQSPRVVSAQELAREVLETNGAWDVEDRVRSYIYRIRRKAQAAGGIDLIRTVRGRGYAMGE